MALLVDDGVRYPFRGDRSFDLLAAGGLAGLVAAISIQLATVAYALPLVVLFVGVGTVSIVVLLGYLFRVFTRTIEGDDTPPGFRPLEPVVRNGCRLLVVTVGYAIVGGAIVGVTVGGLMGTPFSPDAVGFVGSMLFFTASTIVLLVVVTVGYVYPAAVGRVAAGGRLREAATLRLHVPIVAHSGYFTAWMFASLFVVPGWAFLIAALSNATAFGVVAVFVAFYAHVVAVRIVARGYRAASMDAERSL